MFFGNSVFIKLGVFFLICCYEVLKNVCLYLTWCSWICFILFFGKFIFAKLCVLWEICGLVIHLNISEVTSSLVKRSILNHVNVHRLTEPVVLVRETFIEKSSSLSRPLIFTKWASEWNLRNSSNSKDKPAERLMCRMTLPR